MRFVLVKVKNYKKDTKSNIDDRWVHAFYNKNVFSPDNIDCYFDTGVHELDIHSLNKSVKNLDKELDLFCNINNSDANGLRLVGRTIIYCLGETSAFLIADLQHKNNQDLVSYIRDFKINPLL